MANVAAAPGVGMAHWVSMTTWSMTVTAPSVSLRPPEVVRRSSWEDAHETRVANWIRPWDGEETFDVGLLMVPIARGAEGPDLVGEPLVRVPG